MWWKTSIHSLAPILVSRSFCNLYHLWAIRIIFTLPFQKILEDNTMALSVITLWRKKRKKGKCRVRRERDGARAPTCDSVVAWRRRSQERRKEEKKREAWVAVSTIRPPHVGKEKKKKRKRKEKKGSCLKSPWR